MEVHKEDEAHLLEEEKEFFKTHEVLKGYIPPQDPLHDIDTKKTVRLLVAWTVTLFVGIWAMTHLFHFMVQGERHRKVAESEGPLAEELKALRAQEDKELMGADGHLSIEQAKAELLQRSR